VQKQRQQYQEEHRQMEAHRRNTQSELDSLKTRLSSQEADLMHRRRQFDAHETEMKKFFEQYNQ